MYRVRVECSTRAEFYELIEALKEDGTPYEIASYQCMIVWFDYSGKLY